MTDFLALRLEAPLVSFGGQAVDEHRPVGQFPAASLLAGLLGNALGYEHSEGERLNRLQERLVFASRIDRPGHLLRDFQTVDLGQPHLAMPAWTTDGTVETREGGRAARGTHIRYCYYHADRICGVVLTLSSPAEKPTVDDLERALDEPCRPLFIGRRHCLPTVPLKQARRPATSLLEALTATAPAGRLRRPVQLPATEATALPGGHIGIVTDQRDWIRQIHSGSRTVWEGVLRCPR